MKTYVALLSCLICIPCDAYSRVPDQHDASPVSVVDAIQMTQLVDPDHPNLDSPKYDPVNFSPDGKNFIIVTKRGNIEQNTNDYSLLLFQTDGVLRSPTPKVLVLLSSSSLRPGIQHIQWVDNHTIAFLGENAGELQQVYEVDCETRQLSKLTNHSTNVTSFAISPNNNTFLFLAEPERSVEPLFEGKTGRQGVVVVSSQSLWDLLGGENRS